jgi:nicotinamidase/pyrazinamidase
MEVSMTTCLLVIDGQVDFAEGGKLAVPGTAKNMELLGKMIDKNGKDIDEIQLTMDSHYEMHIAHPLFWEDPSGKEPPIFTLISEDDVKGRKWRPKNKNWKDWALEYTGTLAKNKRYVLCIWPPHCIIGSPGQTLVPSLFDAVTRWEVGYKAIAPRLTKGSNPFTEHYSAVKADCPRNDDSGTRLNTRFIDTLKAYDNILISGEALSHCVANTIRDVAAEFALEQIKKFVLLTDASSNVGGFEKMGEDFVNEMAGKGMRLAKTTDFFK